MTGENEVEDVVVVVDLIRLACLVMSLEDDRVLTVVVVVVVVLLVIRGERNVGANGTKRRAKQEYMSLLLVVV